MVTQHVLYVIDGFKGKMLKGKLTTSNDIRE